MRHKAGERMDLAGGAAVHGARIMERPIFSIRGSKIWIAAKGLALQSRQVTETWAAPMASPRLVSTPGQGPPSSPAS